MVGEAGGRHQESHRFTIITRSCSMQHSGVQERSGICDTGAERIRLRGLMPGQPDLTEKEHSCKALAKARFNQCLSG